MGRALTTFSNARWWIAAVLTIQAALLPWTGHAYDASAFLSHAERVYFAHVPPAVLWPFGSISLAVLLLSQVPVLFVPALWSAIPLRLFLLKFPAWCADVASAFIIRACSANPASADLWALRYLTDPAVIFVTIFHGQNDALPNVFAVGGIALMISERYELAGLLFGLGTGTKFYPAAFVPLLLVCAYRHVSLRVALRAFGVFGVAALVTLVPVLWGRAGSVFEAYQNNSFGPATGVSSASLWALLPRLDALPALPRIEQLVALLVPIGLAVAELRHAPDRRDVARAAMLTAMSIVLLNPGVHPPFYLWIAGPLVLYAAVAGDEIVSFGGLALSSVAVLAQFCQEGSDEYFRLNFGNGPDPRLLRCVSTPTTLTVAMLVAAAIVVVAAYRRELSRRAAPFVRPFVRAASAIVFACFTLSIGVEVAYAAATHASGPGYRDEERIVNTFAVDPAVVRGAGGCELTFTANDVIVYAGNPFAARFATASLGYTLFSPEVMTIRGRSLPVESLPSSYENIDVRTIRQQTVRITREFDVTTALRPFRYVERLAERPCGLIRNNPVLIYRFDLGAARAAAAALPLRRRLDVFDRGKETFRTPINGRYHA